MYTDGLTEGSDSSGEEFGLARVRQTLLSMIGSSAGEILVRLLELHSEFLGATAPPDDVTVVVLRRLASG